MCLSWRRVVNFVVGEDNFGGSKTAYTTRPLGIPAVHLGRYCGHTALTVLAVRVAVKQTPGGEGISFQRISPSFRCGPELTRDNTSREARSHDDSLCIARGIVGCAGDKLPFVRRLSITLAMVRFQNALQRKSPPLL